MPHSFNLFSKDKANEETFSKEEYRFLKLFLSPFLIFTPILHINLIYKVWVDLINEKQAETHILFGRKNESHGINLTHGQGVLPENYNYLNRTRAHFIIKQIGLRNMNTIRAYITITMEITFMKRAAKVTATLITKVTVFLIAKVTGTAKNNVKSERNIIVSINTLQSLITSATRCKICHGSVRFVENRKNAVGLACLLKIESVNQKCKPTDNNSTMPMMKKCRSFYEINRSFVLVCRLIGRGYNAALRLTSLLNLDKPVTKKSWSNHMATLCNVAEEIAEGSMKKATIGAKEYKVKDGVLEVPPEAYLSKEK